MNSVTRSIKHIAVIFAMLCCIICLPLMCENAYAAEEVASGTCGDNLTWVLDGAGTLTVSGVGEMSDYQSPGPSIVDGFSPWSNYNFMIEKIIVSEGVTTIGESAFCDADVVSQIVLPNSLEKIGFNAFALTTSLSAIKLPLNLKSIGAHAFYSSGIKAIDIPESVEILGGNAFAGCHNLQSVQLNKNIDEIPVGLFSECVNLSDYKIPDNVKKIGGWAFYGTGLKEVYIPSSVTVIGENAFYKCDSLEVVTISEGVLSINREAFCECPNLTKLYLPESVTSLQDDTVFMGCTTLTIYVISGSYAERYVKAKGLPYKVVCKIHQWNSEPTVDKPASCTEDGSQSIHCSKCGETKDAKVIPATDHSYGEFITTKEPTCTEKGYKEKVCSVCGDKVIEEIDALGHDWNTEPTIDKVATCTEDGSQSIHCSRCTETKDAETIPATGHSFGEWITTKEPTCTENGSKEKNCSACGEKVTEEIPALGHHSFNDWAITKEATEISEGQRTRTCSNCGEKETQSIAQLKPTLPKITISKPKAEKKAATIKWKKVSKKNLKKIKKIEIQYSTDKNFKKNVKSKYVSAKKTSYKIKSLKKGKKYYVRIRAYTKSGGKVRVSKWSARKSFKVE